MKAHLLFIIKKLSKGTPARSTLPILSCVLFEVDSNGVSLRTTDLEITINCKMEASIEEPGSAAIPLQTLMDITNEMSDTRITLSVDEGQKVELITDSGTYDLMGKPVEEFPALPEADNRKASGIKAKVKVKGYVEKKLANVDKIKNKVVNYFLETLFNYK